MAHFYQETEEKKIHSKIEKIELLCVALVYIISFSLFFFFRFMPEVHGVPAFTYWITTIFSNGLAALVPTLFSGMIIAVIGNSLEEDKIKDKKRQSVEQWHAFLHEESRTLNEIAVLKQHHLSSLSLQDIEKRIQSRNELLLEGINLQHTSLDNTCPCCNETFKLNLFGIYRTCECTTVQEMRYTK